MSTTSVSLPELPEDTEFEEFVCAYFQAAGWYTEHHKIDRQTDGEVLELDLVASSYDPDRLLRMLAEIKSGGWGFEDVFKVRGWLDYLRSLPRGVVITSKPKKSEDLYRRIAGQLGIDVVMIPDLDKAAEHLGPLLGAAALEEADVAMWRFSFWARRALLKKLNVWKKSLPDEKCYGAVERYHFAVADSAFFIAKIVDQVDTLYDTFRENAHLSAKCGNELDGGDFEEAVTRIPESQFKLAFYQNEMNVLQVSTYVEHHARLAILKAAIDFHVLNAAGDDDRTSHTDELFGMTIDTLKLLPRSFQEGLQKLAKHEYVHRYAVFWQWFLWAFGGFILTDRLDQEYALLAKKTGIPVEQVPKALEAFDLLFETEKGWLADLGPHSNVKIVRLFPHVLMGVGANYRRLVYGNVPSFGDLKLAGSRTEADLGKWNNLLVELLAWHAKVEPRKQKKTT
ncbi:MAG: hypothetical protein HY905_08855 [Deltaproteobacteria bacterium]|nr:hypothetical protein [Deltaproteobacteria bacterium]